LDLPSSTVTRCGPHDPTTPPRNARWSRRLRGTRAAPNQPITPQSPQNLRRHTTPSHLPHASRAQIRENDGHAGILCWDKAMGNPQATTTSAAKSQQSKWVARATLRAGTHKHVILQSWPQMWAEKRRPEGWLCSPRLCWRIPPAFLHTMLYLCKGHCSHGRHQDSSHAHRLSTARPPSQTTAEYLHTEPGSRSTCRATPKAPAPPRKDARGAWGLRARASMSCAPQVFNRPRYAAIQKNKRRHQQTMPNRTRRGQTQPPPPKKAPSELWLPICGKKRFVKSGPAAVCTKGAGVMQHQPTENRSRQIHGPQLKVVGSNNSCHLDVTLSAQRGPVAAVHQRPTPLLQTVPYHIEILTHPPHRNSDPGLKQPLRAPETAQGNFPLAFTACAQTDHHRGWHDLKKRRNGGATLGA